MPKYELMYILASSVSDDQVPAITEQVKKYVADFGGTEVIESQLGKKKLAYPIKKTRNGFYVVVNFSMESRQVSDLDAKIRTQGNTIIRYILVNLDEHLERLEKDKVAQSKLSRRPENSTEEDSASGYAPQTAPFTPQPMVEEKPVSPLPVKKEEIPVIEMTTEELDKKIEEALTEDLLK